MQHTFWFMLAAAAVFFAAQLVCCFGTRRRRLRLAPVWVICGAAVLLLCCWLAGLGQDPVGGVLSLREAKCLFCAALLLSAAAGDGLAWLGWRATAWRTR